MDVNATKVVPSGAKGAIQAGKEKREAKRKAEAEEYEKYIQEKKKCTQFCCTGPKDWKEAYKAGLSEQAGPISRMEYRIEYWNTWIGFISIIGIGVAFVLNWVVMKQISFTHGYPMPMFVDGGCMCGDNFCDDVLFTFNLKMENKTHLNNYNSKWLHTQYYDYEQFMIPKAPKVPDGEDPGSDKETLKLSIRDSQDVLQSVSKLKNANIGDYITFESGVLPYKLYDDVETKDAHLTCNNHDGLNELGTKWKKVVGTDGGPVCTKSVSLRLMSKTFNESAKTTILHFAQTLTVLSIPDAVTDEEPMKFTFPLCKQGPQAFSDAGLKGLVYLKEAEDGAKLPGASENRLRNILNPKIAEDENTHTRFKLWKECFEKENGFPESDSFRNMAHCCSDEPSCEKFRDSNSNSDRRLLSSRMLSSEYKEISSGKCEDHEGYESPSSVAACNTAYKNCFDAGVCTDPEQKHITEGVVKKYDRSDYPHGCYFRSDTCTGFTRCRGIWFNERKSGTPDFKSPRSGVCVKKSSDNSGGGGGPTCTTCSSPESHGGWGRKGNEGCVTGSGCDCSDNKGASCRDDLSAPVYTVTRETGLDKCGITFNEVDMCMVDTPTVNTGGDTSARGQVYPSSMYAETSETKMLGVNPCRANPSPFSIVQVPEEKLLSYDNDHCWIKNPLTDNDLDPTAMEHDKNFSLSWGHEQQWAQPNQFDNSKMFWIGVLLGTLCSLMAYMEFTSTFVPEAHPLRNRCEVPKIIATLITALACPCTATLPDKKGGTDNEKDKQEMLANVVSWEAGPEKESADVGVDDFGGRCGNKSICSKQKTFIRGPKGSAVRDQLVYLLITLPFNFMLACYTVPGESFVDAETTAHARKVGLWALGSPVAVELIEMPTIFVIIIFSSLFGVGPLAGFLMGKMKSQTFDFNAWAFTTASVIFLAWFGISMWIFSVNAANTISNTQLSFGDLIFGVDPRKWFTIPSIQLPTSILSFVYGFTKLWNFVFGGIKKIALFLKSRPKLSPSKGGGSKTVFGEAKSKLEEETKNKVKESLDTTGQNIQDGYNGRGGDTEESNKDEDTAVNTV